MARKDPKLEDILILFDKILGISIFKNLRAYDDAVIDAEWILERNNTTSGLVFRPVGHEGKGGLWIGEYDYNGNAIIRYGVLYGKIAVQIGRLIRKYAQGKITESEAMEKLISNLRKESGSDIVQNFHF